MAYRKKSTGRGSRGGKRTASSYSRRVSGGNKRGKTGRGNQRGQTVRIVVETVAAAPTPAIGQPVAPQSTPRKVARF